MIYAAARVGTVFFWVSMGLCASGWWLAFAALPLFRQLVARMRSGCASVLGRRAARAARAAPAPPVFRPGLGSVGWTAVATSMLTFAWIVLVDPHATPGARPPLT